MTEGADARTPGAGGYAPVNGLNTYYEIHGTGKPLVVLRGAYMTIDTNIPELFAGTPVLEEYTRLPPMRTIFRRWSPS